MKRDEAQAGAWLQHARPRGALGDTRAGSGWEPRTSTAPWLASWKIAFIESHLYWELLYTGSLRGWDCPAALCSCRAPRHSPAAQLPHAIPIERVLPLIGDVFNEVVRATGHRHSISGMVGPGHPTGRAPGAVPAPPSLCPHHRCLPGLAPTPQPGHATRAPAISSNKQLISINHNFAQLS